MQLQKKCNAMQGGKFQQLTFISWSEIPFFLSSEVNKKLWQVYKKEINADSSANTEKIRIYISLYVNLYFNR